MKFDRRSFIAAGAAALLQPASLLCQEEKKDAYFAGSAEDHGIVFRRTNMDAIEAI